MILVEVDERRFVLMSSTGELGRWFGSESYGIDDDMYRSFHVVVGERLYSRHTIDRRYGESERRDELVLDDLVALDDPDTIALAEGAVRAHHAREDQERRRVERAAKAQRATIVSAHGLEQVTGELALARDALVRRIQTYDDQTAAKLLDTLAVVARTQPSADVVFAFARGCRLACFEEPVPGLDAAPDSPAELTPASALAVELLERSRELEQQAQWQSDVDANLNAAAYRRAADAIRRAAQLVSVPP